MEIIDFPLLVSFPTAETLDLWTTGVAGEGRGSSRWPLTSEEAICLYEDLAELHSGESLAEEELKRLGSRLFATLFPGEVAAALERAVCRGEYAPTPTRLRVRIHVDVNSSAGRRFAALPWELCWWPARGRFLFLNPAVALVFHLSLQRGPRPAVEGALRVLLVSAEPSDQPPLSLAAELGRLGQALADSAGVEPLPEVYHATPQRLREALVRHAPVHALHFVGHGGAAGSHGEGYLLFERPDRTSLRLRASRLAEIVRDHPTLRLVVLNACETASMSPMEGRASVAAALVREGVPAVVAMAYPVRHEAATVFSRCFYPRVLAGEPLAAAVGEGRLAILHHLDAGGSGSRAAWAIPRVFDRSTDGRVFDPPAREGEAPQVVRDLVVRSRTLIADRTRGFVGRRWLFESLREFCRAQESGYFVLTGEPGIGKTALVARLTQRQDAVYFFHQRSEGLTSAELCHRSLAAQLVETFRLDSSRLSPELGHNAAALERILDECATRLQPQGRVLLLLDALDEASAAPEREGANAAYLPRLLPRGFHAVVTTRPRVRPLRLEGAVEDFVLHGELQENQEDARELVGSAWGEQSAIASWAAHRGLGEQEFVALVVERSAGNFMYLRHVLRDLSEGGEPFEELPDGLENYYQDHWQRMQREHEKHWDSAYLPLMGVLSVIEQPLSLNAIAYAADLGDPRDLSLLREALRAWRPFLRVVEGHNEAGGRSLRFSLYHESFRDFLFELGAADGRDYELAAYRQRLGMFLKDRV